MAVVEYDSKPINQAVYWTANKSLMSSKKRENLKGTNYINSLKANFLNSRYKNFEVIEYDHSKKIYNENNTKLIKIQKSIDTQYSELKDFFQTHSLDNLKAVVSDVFEQLIGIGINIEKAELTNDRTIFFTLKNGDIKIYLDKYLDEEDDYNMITFKAKEKLPSFSGSLNSLVKRINDIFLQH